MSAERKLAIERLLASEGVSRLQASAVDSAVRRLDEHAEYVKARGVWDDIGDLNADPAYAALLGRPTIRERLVSALDVLVPRRERIYTRLVPVGAVAAVAVLLLLVLPSVAVKHFATQHAELRQIALDDGSIVALGPKSKLDVAFTEGRRNVTMAPGEAFFSVSHDPNRPFVIAVGNTQITVVGTKFNVKYDASGVRVSVVEGVVRVTPPKLALSETPPTLSVPAGKEAIIGAEMGAPVVASLGRTRPDNWRTGQLDYNDLPLGEIVSDLNRYIAGEVQLESPRLAGVRLTASLPEDQAMQFIESLPSLLPVSIERHNDRIIVRERSAAQRAAQ
jgi:transmembrane sensor